MAKSRSRSASARRAPTKKARTTRTRKSSGARRAAAGGAKVVQLKPLYEQLGRTIDRLEQLPPSDRVKFAIARLQQCRSDFEEICGPTMAIPAESAPPNL